MDAGVSISGKTLGQKNDTQPDDKIRLLNVADKNGTGHGIGYGSDSDRQESITHSGINTSNLQITDEAGQIRQTGLTAEETRAKVYTGTTTESAQADAGSLYNRFDKEQVQRELDTQTEVTQTFSHTRQQIWSAAATKAQAHREKAENLARSAEVAEKNGDHATAAQLRKEAESERQQAKRWQWAGVAVNMVGAGLSAPTQSSAGIAANAAAPAASYVIGQEFKRRNAEGSLGHLLAHATLGGLTAAAGGNDPLAGALSSGGAEAAAGYISRLFGQTDAEQKRMIAEMAGLFGTAAGAALGSTPADVAQGSLNAKNAVENNALSDREIITEGKRIDEICKTSNNLARCRLNEISKLIPRSDAKSHLSEAEIQLIENIENQALQEVLSICKFNHECINNAEQEFIYARLHCDTAACMKEQGNIIIRAISFKYENILGIGLRLFNDFSPVLPVTSMVGKTTRIKPNGIVELFTDSRGATIKGAVGVGPTDSMAVARDARFMPNIPTGSQARVIANNPYIPASTGGKFTIMDYLPEAARITRKGGEIIINGTTSNKYLRGIPNENELASMGLRLKYNGTLKPEFTDLNFRTTDGKILPTNRMKTIIFEKVK